MPPLRVSARTGSTSSTSTASIRPFRAGKVRAWGLSNVRAWHIPVIAAACREVGAPPPVVLQPCYNLMSRMPEVELLPAARAFDLGVAAYSPLARGILSGKYRPGDNAPPDTRAGRNDRRIRPGRL